MFAIDWNIVGVIVALAYCGLLAVLMMRKSLCAAFAHVKAMPRPVQVVTAIDVVAPFYAQRLSTVLNNLFVFRVVDSIRQLHAVGTHKLHLLQIKA